jgi:hypothetical protein
MNRPPPAPRLGSFPNERRPVENYVILRRGAWRTPDELRAAAARSADEGDKTPDDVRWIRSYVLAETSGELGTVCIYQASSPEAIRAHAYRAGLPVDEIVAVADTVVVRPDPQPVAA